MQMCTYIPKYAPPYRTVCIPANARSTAGVLHPPSLQSVQHHTRRRLTPARLQRSGRAGGSEDHVHEDVPHAAVAERPSHGRGDVERGGPRRGVAPV